VKIGNYPTVNNSSSLPTGVVQFGGFTTGQSRNTNSTPYDSNYTPDYSGWRVWSKDETTGIVTLISAGHPETYNNSVPADGDMPATGAVSKVILQNRDCSMYANEYAILEGENKPHILTGEEVKDWLNNQFGTSYSGSEYSGNDLPTTNSIDVLDNGAYYWIAEDYDYVFSLFGYIPDARAFGSKATGALGVRVLVTLKSDVMTQEDGDEYGTQGNPWKIKGQDPTPTPWTGGVATGFASGTGTETDPYMIETAEQLAYLASSTNSGTTYEGKYIALGADIDLGGVQNADGSWSGRQWTPIGTSSNPFKGNFNGNGYSISNIYINNDELDYLGLFGYIVEGKFKNICIDSGYIVEVNYSAANGVICGYLRNSDEYLDVSVSNCLNKATIVGRSGYSGGIVGLARYITFIDCINYGDVSGYPAGGVCGGLQYFLENNSSDYLIDCLNYGEINEMGSISNKVVGATASID